VDRAAPRCDGPRRRVTRSETRAPVQERLELAIVLAAAVLHLVPIWSVRHFATQDGPAHLETTMAVLRHAAVPVVARYYEINAHLVPNGLGDAVLAVLLALFSPAIAEKVLLTGYIVGLPLAFRFALPPSARRRFFTLAAFPFVYSFSFHMGFTSYLLSLVLFFLAIGVWTRRRGRLGLAGAALLGALTSIAALGHAVTLVLTVVALWAILSWRAARSAWKAHPPRRARVLRLYAKLALATSAALAPGILLVLSFVLTGGDGGARWLPFWRHLYVLGAYALAGVQAYDIWISWGVTALILVALAITAATSGGGARSSGGLLFAAGSIGLVAALAPEEIGSGTLITPRLAVFPLLLAVAWIGARRRIAGAVRVIPFALCAASLLLLALRQPVYRRVSEAVDEYLSVSPLVPRGTVLLPLQLSTGRLLDEDRVEPIEYKPLLHVAGYLAAERDVVDLTNYQGNLGYFPIRFRAGLNPFTALHAADLQGVYGLPCVDLDSAPKELGIDNVLVWIPAGYGFEGSCVDSWMAQLHSEYQLVAVSRPNGQAYLYRRR
jgi:hypothetical protein